MTSKQLRVALEELEWELAFTAYPSRNLMKAITAIKQALAAPVQTDWEAISADQAMTIALLKSEAAAQPAPVQEQAEQLAKLGWQAIECPFCGSSGAQAFPKSAAFAKDKSESAYQRGYMDGSAKRPQPLTDEQISAMCKQTWVFETARQWVRVTEAAHNIKGAA